jgi:hypothetical protein
VGCIISIALLMMVMLESFTIRAVIDGKSVDRSSFINGNLTMKKWWADSEWTDKEKVIEAFALRDAIAHNHVYWCQRSEDCNEIVVGERLVGGDTKFSNRTSDGKFKDSGLSSSPSAIDPKDLLILMDVVKNALRFLQTRCSRIGLLDFGFVRYGTAKNLWELVALAANRSMAKLQRID